MATPVLAELAASLADYERRLLSSGARVIDVRRTCSRPPRGARLDRRSCWPSRPSASTSRLAGSTAGLQANTATHAQALARVAGRLNPRLLQREAEQNGAAADRDLRVRLAAGHGAAAAARRDERLTSLRQAQRVPQSQRPLRRGYALVFKGDGKLVRTAAELRVGRAVRMEFQDGKRDAVVDGDRVEAVLRAAQANPTRAISSKRRLGALHSPAMNAFDMDMAKPGEIALVRYGDGEVMVLRPGRYVICAVTGKKIPLEALRYWNPRLQEAYAGPAEALTLARASANP